MDRRLCLSIVLTVILISVLMRPSLGRESSTRRRGSRADFVPQAQGLDMKVGATPAAAPSGDPDWLVPAFSFIEFLITHFKHHQTPDQALLDNMNKDQQGLKPLPEFLDGSRNFRVLAVDLSREIVLGADSDKADVADVIWGYLQGDLKNTKDAFATAYKAKAIDQLLSESPGGALVQARDDCQRALDNISDTISKAPTTLSSDDKLRSLGNMKGDANNLAKCSQKPEYVMAEASNTLADDYASMIKMAKSLFPTNPTNAGGFPQTFRTQASIRLVAYVVQGVQQPEKSTAGPNAAQSTALQSFREDISKPVTPPAWMLAVANSSIRSSAPISPSWPLNASSFAGGLVLGLAGFAGALRLAPGFFEKLGLLRIVR